MSRFFLLMLLGSIACGETEAEVDPRCERGWVCGLDISTREGCVDGDYVTQDCAEGEWCLDVRKGETAEYEASCVPRSWRAGGCSEENDICADGWICFDGVCREDCNINGAACLVKNHSCFATAGAPTSLCLPPEYPQ